MCAYGFPPPHNSKRSLTLMHHLPCDAHRGYAAGMSDRLGWEKSPTVVDHGPFPVREGVNDDGERFTVQTVSVSSFGIRPVLLVDDQDDE